MFFFSRKEGRERAAFASRGRIKGEKNQWGVLELGLKKCGRGGKKRGGTRSWRASEKFFIEEAD